MGCELQVKESRNSPQFYLVKLNMLFLTIVLVLPMCRAQLNNLPVIRNTTLGQVLGSIDKPLPDSVQVERYFGIPYAKPPVGDLRFEDPVLMSPWEPKVLETLKLHPACPQIDEDMLYIAEHRVDFNHTDEDCLYLNVFVPVLTNATKTHVTIDANNNNSIPSGTTYGQNDGEPLPVLVFIHGGSNVVGTANMFDGDVLAATGEIIVVTINYRLAALGFLGTGHPDFPGNYGILDQIAALRWVQNNIASFNGDPTKVTVMGHSQGSFDVGVLLVSPLAKGLFRTAICQSGPPTSPFTHRRTDYDSVLEVLSLGMLFKCQNITLAGVKNCLKKIDVVPLLKSHPMYDFNQFPAIVGDKVLPKTPKELMETGELNAQTLLIGTTRDEAAKWSFSLGGYDYLYGILQLLHVVPTAIHFKDLVAFEYTDMSYPSNETTNTRIGSMTYGDAIFDAPAVEALQVLSNRNITVNQYRWEWRSDVYPDPEVTGVPHGVDLFYLFGSPLTGHPLYNYTEQDKRMSRLMMKQWSHFVKFSSFELNQKDWPNLVTSEELPYNNNTRAYTRFFYNDGTPAMALGFNLKPRQTKFWSSVIPDLYDQINRTLANWNANPNQTTSPGGQDPGLVDINELKQQKDLFLILFLIFLVLSCFLLLLMLFICVLYCTSKNSNKYSMK